MKISTPLLMAFALALSLNGSQRATAEPMILGNDFSIPDDCTIFFEQGEQLKDGRRITWNFAIIKCANLEPQILSNVNVENEQGTLRSDEKAQRRGSAGATSPATASVAMTPAVDVLAQARAQRDLVLRQNLAIPRSVRSGLEAKFHGGEASESFGSAMREWGRTSFKLNNLSRDIERCSTALFECHDDVLMLKDQAYVAPAPTFYRTMELAKLLQGDPHLSLRGYGHGLPAHLLSGNATAIVRSEFERAKFRIMSDTFSISEHAKRMAERRGRSALWALQTSSFDGRDQKLRRYLHGHATSRDLKAKEGAKLQAQRARRSVPFLKRFTGAYWRIRALERELEGTEPSTPQGVKAAEASHAAVAGAYTALASNDSDQAQKLTDIAAALASISADLLPATGWPKAVYEAAVGEDLITGEVLSELDRGAAVFAVITFGAGSSVKGAKNAMKWILRTRNGRKYQETTISIADLTLEQWRRNFGLSRGRSLGGNAAEYQQLKTRLEQEENLSILFRRLNNRFASSPPNLRGAGTNVRGERIRDPRAIKTLTQDGSSIDDWRKYSEGIGERSGVSNPTTINFYWNEKTKKLWPEVKVKVYQKLEIK